jgi:hypothetical protein
MALVEATCREFKGMIHAADLGGYSGEGAVGAGARTPIPAFQRIAEWGRGSAVALTDETELLKCLLVLTLGANYRTAVETLFGL